MVIQKETDHFQLWQTCEENQNKAKNPLVERALKNSNKECKLFEECEEFMKFGLAEI